MSSRRCLAGVLLCTAAIAGTARADERNLIGTYLDIFAPEAVGFRGDHLFDLSDENGDFAGKQAVRGGTFLGAGHGFRNLFVLPHGALLLDELLLAWGDLDGAQMQWQQASRAMRFEILIGAGWGFPVGPFYFHTATVLGGAWLGFDVIGATNSDVALASVGAPSSSPMRGSLSIWDFRAGQEVGVHLQIARLAAIFADGTIDYDGQWRVRAGISVGTHDLEAGRR